MDKEALKTRLAALAPDLEFDEACTDYLLGVLPAPQLYAVAEKLRNEEDLLFDFLFCLSGVDYPATDQLFVVYHFRSTVHDHDFCLKARIDGREDPHVATVSDIWKTAEFHEREAYDFYGIVFDGHPDLRRIFLEDDWTAA